MQIRSLRISVLALGLACFFEFVAHADPPANNLCATINNTSDYMNCLRSVNPTLAKHIDSAPGGAEGYFNQLSSITGIPVSQWISNKNPPTPEQAFQALSQRVPESQGLIAKTLQNLKQFAAGKRGPGAPMAAQPAANSSASEPDAPSFGSKIASFFGTASTQMPPQNNAQTAQQSANSVSTRNADSIAQDPGISLFKRVEQKYQEITPRMLPGTGPTTLKDWGSK